MTASLKIRLILVSLTPILFSCAHRPLGATVDPVRQETMFDCFAEVVDVKHEVWKVRLSAHSYPDSVWQGALKISLRFLSPAAHAGEVRSLGVYEEHEIVFGGRVLAAGDTIRFAASEGVLQRSIVPEVFSNLRGVTRTEIRANKAPEPTPPSVMPRAGARATPAGVVAHL
jgi:hypothetical protein